jgi:hypothetical protein
VRQPVRSSERNRSLVPDSGFFLHSAVPQPIGIGLECAPGRAGNSDAANVPWCTECVSDLENFLGRTTHVEWFVTRDDADGITASLILVVGVLMFRWHPHRMRWRLKGGST